MPDLEVSADIDAFMGSANNAAARTNLGLGALATITPGTGISAALQANVGSAGAPILFNGALGTPSSGTLTNCTIPVGQITGAGTGVLTALSVNVGSAGAVVVQNGDAGTPSALVGTNITGTAAGLTAGTASAVAVGGITGLGTGVATFLATPSSANLRAAVTDESGTGALLFAGGALGTPTSGVGTNFTGIPISTGLTGAGTGVLAAMAVNVGSAGAFVTFNGAGGTPSSLTLTNATGLPVGGVSATGTPSASTFLRGDGSWATPAGSGDVVGPASSTDSVPAMFDGTTGKLLKNSTPTGTGNPVLATGPTISGATLSGTTTASTVNAGTANITTFKVLDAVDQSHGLSFVVSSDLAADKTFTYTGAFNYTMTLTADTSVAFPTSGTLAVRPAVKITAASYTIGTTDPNELYGGVIFVTGAATITVPAVGTGMSFTVITEGAVAVSVDPNAADLIVLDGTALSDGDKITNLSTAGDMAVFVARDATGWSAQTNGWTDTN